MSDDVVGTASTASDARAAAQPRTGIVIVHGAGIWATDYWKPVVNAIQRASAAQPRRRRSARSACAIRM